MEKNSTKWRKIENKLIQCKEFDMKERQLYNVAVSINHHPNLEKMLLSIVRSPMDV